jgi:ribosomal protein S18 acetylase RimI-like enzyme
MKTQIVKAEIKDIPLISELAHIIWSQAFYEILTKEMLEDMLEKIYSTEALKKEMLELGHQFWLVKTHEDYLGYASAYEKETTLWIKKIYLKPEAQGLGLGKALIQNAIQYFPQSKKISLYVNKDNENARHFYERQGFKKESEEKVMMGSFEFNDLIMSKPL